MQLSCVIMRDDVFFAGIKITTKNILSQMITQGDWIYKFIQFNLIEKCTIFLLKSAKYERSQV